MTQIHVSPGGRADAVGDEHQPVNLREALRRSEDTATKPAEVVLAGGTYALDEPLVFTPRHNGDAGGPLRLRAASGAEPVITAGRAIEDWRRLDHAVPGLSDEAAARVWYAPIGEAAFRTLYQDGQQLQRACAGPLMTDEQRNDEASDTLLPARSGDLSAWSNPGDIDVFIMPEHVWQAQYLPVEAVDLEARTITTRVPGTYRLIATGKQNPPLYYWLDNVPEGLTGPGQWMLDTRLRVVYLWPHGDEPREITYPGISELVRFEGVDGAPCAHIEISGLTFTQGDRLSWPMQRRACQHDWQVFDWPDAMVRLRGARDVAVRHCRFIEAGATGLRMDGFAVSNTVERCDFERLGGNGIAVLGEEPGGREVSHHNTIQSNHIHDTGRLWWQASGILIVQSGWNEVVDNYLHEISYSGITLVSGREGAFGALGPNNGKDGRLVDDDTFGAGPVDWHYVIGHLDCRHNRIAFNDIHDAMTRLGDGNGIYISGTGWGNIVEGNHVHDMTGAIAGIRTDDMQWYTRIERNVVRGLKGGGFILKHVNDVTDNIFLDCAHPEMVLFRRAPSWGANIKRNVLVLNEIPEATKEPPAPFYGGGFKGDVRQPNVDDNLLWCPSEPERARRALVAMRELGHERHSLVGDPCFVDAGSGDFRLRPDSPALNLGIRSLSQWGVRGPVGALSRE